MLLIIPHAAGAGPELRNRLILRGEGYATESERDPARGRAEGALESELTAGRRLRLHLEGALRLDTAGWYERRLRVDLLERDEAPAALTLSEAWAQLRLGEIDVRAGKTIYAWGSADGWNPTDNLNPRDYTDPFRGDKLGAVSVAVGWQKGDLGVDLVLLPVYQPSRLPALDNRFFPALPSVVENPLYPAVGPALLAVDYELPERVLPGITTTDVQEAVRLSYKLPGSLVSITWQRLISDLPTFDVVVGLPDFGRGTVPVAIRQRFFRQDVYGADFQTAVSDFTLRGEAARVVAHDDLAEDYLFAACGIDRRFSDIVGEQDVTVILSVLSQRVTRASSLELPGATLLSIDRPFEHAVLLHALWELNDDVTLDASLLSAFDRGDYEELLLSYRLRDPLKLELKLERGAGPSDSFLGAVQDSSRLWAQLTYSF